MRKINENKNEQKTNATINKIFEEMQYAEEYIKRWNISLLEHYSDIYSIDLYYLRKSDFRKVQELEKKYYNQFDLMDIYKYIVDKNKLDINYGQPLKKVTLYDEEGNDYACEFRLIEWSSMSSNRTKRNFTFKNNGDITYSKNKKKSLNLDYSAKYNVNSNDLNITFYLDNEKFQIESYNNIQYITSNNLEVETNIVDGSKKISYKKENLENQSLTFVIELDKFSKIINKYIEVKNYDQNKQVNSTYEFYFKNDDLMGALYFTKEHKKYNMLDNPELTNMAINILSTINKDNLVFNLTPKELEKVILEIKEKAFKLIKSIKSDIPLYGLEKRLDITLSNINAKIAKKEENIPVAKRKENPKTLKKESKKVKNKTKNRKK